MNTSIVLVALASLISVSEAPSWSTDYSQARNQGRSQQKPLAVVFATGTDGQDKVCRDGKLTAETHRILADKYVCLYVDVNTPAGKELASSFGITQSQGLVISSRTGDLQAFNRDGDLSTGEVTRALERFSDPNLSITTTVTDLNARASLYPPANGGSQAAPVYYQYLSGSSYCPTCQQR